MKGGSLFKKIIYSSWFLASVPAIIIMLFLPRLGVRHKLLIEPKGSMQGQSSYYDLNSDSVTEFLRTGKGIPYYFILILSNDMKVYDQWNLMDDINPDLSGFFCGNYDHDNFSEIYIFTHKGDSLFLNINEFFEPSGTKLERLFISKIGYIKGEVTSTVRLAGFHDVNGDGRDELYFSLHTGFGLQPRRLCYYDIKNRKMHESRLAGIVCQYPQMTDADGDGKPEIFGIMGASGNYKNDVPFSDWSTWFMIFNDNLDHVFPPVEFRGFPNTLEINAFRSDSLRGYVLSNRTTGADTTVNPSRILLYSTDGKLIRSKKYSDDGINGAMFMKVVRQGKTDKIYVLEDKIFEFDEKLNVVRRSDLPLKQPYYIYSADINFDGTDEFFLYSGEQEKVEVYTAGFQWLSETEFKAPGLVWEFSRLYSGNETGRLYLSSGGSGYFFRLTDNKFFYFAYLAYPGIYLFFLALIILTKKISAYQVIEKESLKHRLVTLQLQGIKAQLDPHFTFNTLNSISSLIYLEDRQAAYDYMNKFTMLLRGMLNDAERIYRSLDEEIIFVSTYLDLEKLRLVGKFDYVIEIGEGVTKHEQVPKLVLQTFAENSIKHGIMPYSEGGLLKISVSREKNQLKLAIEDNGIGRVNAAGKGDSTGLGLKLTSEFYNILNQINKRPIRHQITDLYKESGDPAGTRVEVWVPVE
jgi:two-component sensor histidine kinase